MNELLAEKQLFLYELTGRGYEFRNKSWCADRERFEDDQLNMAWEMWLASKNREGYKLVPVRCNNKMAHAAKAVDGRLSAFKYGDVWDAMIGAVE